MTTAYATLADLAALGLPSAALSACTTVLGPVTHTGSGTGTATPSGTPVGSWSCVVQIVVGGAVGAATYRYSTDAGTTWSAAAPVQASVALGATGLLVAFVGATAPSFIAGDTYAFTATAAAQAALDAACDEADGYLRVRYTLPLVTWGADLKNAVCSLAAETILTTRGFNPELAGDPAVQARASRARSWLRDVANGITHPTVTASVPEVLAPEAVSDTVRGW